MSLTGAARARAPRQAPSPAVRVAEPDGPEHPVRTKGSDDRAVAPSRPARLDPAHYEPARVPREVRRHAAVPDTLPVGHAGKVGLLELTFERRAERTELTGHFQKTPLQIMRPLYYDPARPDLPITQVMSTGGGILQGDRLRIDVTCGPGAATHLTTQTATRVHRMEFDYATQQVAVDAGADSYVEYLPDPTIPYGGARYYQRTTVTADATATVLAAETLYAGRLARDERHAYEVFASDVEIRRPDGALLAVDAMRLEPGAAPVTGLAVLGGHDIVSTFYVVTARAPAAAVADTLHEALADSPALFGVSVLPGDSGAWLRLLTDDPRTAASALRLAWDAVRRLLIGVPAPAMRKP
ncbi:urease accessory protein UreD [Streptomyces sp. NPDC093221]|uniref:urease accessory protein UreD n=1 Tax=Streptomyces sp. NPDC093221 TaxID=3366032 RepID=UPI0037F72FF3